MPTSRTWRPSSPPPAPSPRRQPAAWPPAALDQPAQPFPIDAPQATPLSAAATTLFHNLLADYRRRAQTEASPTADNTAPTLPTLASDIRQDQFVQATGPEFLSRLRHYHSLAAASGSPLPTDPFPSPAPPCLAAPESPAAASGDLPPAVTPTHDPDPVAGPGSATSQLLGLSVSLSDADSPPAAPAPAGPPPRSARPSLRLSVSNRPRNIRSGTTSPGRHSDTADDTLDDARAPSAFFPSPPRSANDRASAPSSERPDPPRKSTTPLRFPAGPAATDRAL